MAEEGDLLIEGTVYDPNTMTFREQRQMKRIIRDELFPGEDLEDVRLEIADYMPAMATVLRRRDRPDFTLDDALGLTYHETHITQARAKELNAPPPKRAASRAKSTRAASGSQT